MLRLLTLIGMMLLSPTLLAQGQTRYISDDVFIYIHGGPGTQYRILGSVEAGQQISVLPERQGDYTKIIDHKDREGWVLTSMISKDKSLRFRVSELESQLVEAKSQLTGLQSENGDFKGELGSLKSQLSKAQAELAQASAERDEAIAKLKSMKDNERFRMWQEGGLIAALGLILGVILVYMPRPQRRKKDRWM